MLLKKKKIVYVKLKHLLIFLSIEILMLFIIQLILGR